MASKTTAEEDPAGPLTGAELVRIVQTDLDARTTAQDIANLAPIAPAHDFETGTSRTLDITDAPYGNGVVTMTNANPNQVIVPHFVDVPWLTGTTILVSQLGAGQTSVVGAAGTGGGAAVTILTPSTLNCRKQYSSILLIYLGSDTWLLAGDMA